MLDLVYSLPDEETGWEEFPQSDLFCIKVGVNLNQSIIVTLYCLDIFEIVGFTSNVVG